MSSILRIDAIEPDASRSTPAPGRPPAAPTSWGGERAWVIFAIYAVGLSAWSWTGQGVTTALATALGTLLFLPLNLGAAFFLIRAGRNPAYDDGERRGLRLLGVMYVFTALGNVVWAFDDGILGLDPRFSWANAFYIVSYLVGIIGARSFPIATSGVAALRKFFIDVACVVIAIGVLSWTFVVEPVQLAESRSLNLVVQVAYPIACIVLMAYLCRLILRESAFSRNDSIAIAAVAIVIQCSLDLILELDYRNQVTQLTSFAATICPAVYVVVIWAAQRASIRQREGHGSSRDLGLTAVHLLPTISGIAVYMVLLWAVQSDRRQPLGVLAVAALTLNILFTARHTIATRENVALLAERADAERREGYELRAREGQKLEAVGRLAGGVAHDFNNLLTTVLANSDFALTRLRPGDPGHEEVSDIRTAAVRGAELIRQLLAFSRQSVTAPVRLHPDLVLREIERLMQRLAGENCRLLLDMPPDLGTVLADRGQLEQVIANLVSNARDAMPDGGLVVISGRNSELDGRAAAALGLEPGPYVSIAVSDSGTGIPADVISHIFEPFFSTKPRGKGTGLGLASSYGIMRQSHGAIDVESAVGSGTRFTLYFPRVTEPARPRAPIVFAPEAAARATRTETILLVEDETAVRQVARRMLLAEGYHVFTAADAMAARAQFALHGQDIDLMVTDIMMPGESGIELAAYAQGEWPRTAVLFISGYSDAELPEGSRAGVRDNLVQKPFTASQLLDRVDAALESRRTAPAL